MPNQTVRNGLKAQKIKLPQMNFFLEKQKISHVPISPFHSAKFWILKFLELIQSYQNVQFRGTKWPICSKQFFWKIINIIFIWILPSFIVQTYKKILPVHPDLWGCAILGIKRPICLNENFFRKSVMNLVPFIHECPHAKNQSEILIY